MDELTLNYPEEPNTFDIHEEYKNQHIVQIYETNDVVINNFCIPMSSG